MAYFVRTVGKLLWARDVVCLVPGREGRGDINPPRSTVEMLSVDGVAKYCYFNHHYRILNLVITGEECKIAV